MVAHVMIQLLDTHVTAWLDTLDHRVKQISMIVQAIRVIGEFALMVIMNSDVSVMPDTRAHCVVFK